MRELFFIFDFQILFVELAKSWDVDCLNIRMCDQNFEIIFFLDVQL